MNSRKSIWVGDLHFPFHNPVALAVVLYLIKIRQPRVVGQIGDLKDLLAATKFTRSQNCMKPRDEFAKARYLGECFWEMVQKLVPGVECYQIKGNHDARPAKRIMETAPVFESQIEEWLEEAYTFHGVHTVHDSREELDIGDVRHIHGYTNAGLHAFNNRMNCVVGHSHLGGTYFRPIGNKIYWELNCGYLGNRFHPALSYTQQKRMTKWTLGCGEYDDFGPRFHHIHEADLLALAQDPEIKKLILD